MLLEGIKLSTLPQRIKRTTITPQKLLLRGSHGIWNGMVQIQALLTLRGCVRKKGVLARGQNTMEV
jgi:hypothetical protein